MTPSAWKSYRWQSYTHSEILFVENLKRPNELRHGIFFYTVYVPKAQYEKFAYKQHNRAIYNVYPTCVYLLRCFKCAYFCLIGKIGLHLRYFWLLKCLWNSSISTETFWYCSWESEIAISSKWMPITNLGSSLLLKGIAEQFRWSFIWELSGLRMYSCC